MYLLKLGEAGRRNLYHRMMVSRQRSVLVEDRGNIRDRKNCRLKALRLTAREAVLIHRQPDRDCSRGLRKQLSNLLLLIHSVRRPRNRRQLLWMMTRRIPKNRKCSRSRYLPHHLRSLPTAQTNNQAPETSSFLPHPPLSKLLPSHPGDRSCSSTTTSPQSSDT